MTNRTLEEIVEDIVETYAHVPVEELAQTIIDQYEKEKRRDPTLCYKTLYSGLFIKPKVTFQERPE